MKAFLACSAKSRVVEKVEDIDHGWDALSDTNKAFIRSIIDGAPPDHGQAPSRSNGSRRHPPKRSTRRTRACGCRNVMMIVTVCGAASGIPRNRARYETPTRSTTAAGARSTTTRRPENDVDDTRITTSPWTTPRRRSPRPSLATHPPVEPAARFTRYGPHGPVPVAREGLGRRAVAQHAGLVRRIK